MQVSFLGAAGTVTGSKYLLTLEHKKILIDCGLFQGRKELVDRNWDKLPILPRDIDAVIITHAHLDHSGYLPALVKQGYTGPIYATPGTQALCALALPDSGRIQEEKAHYMNKHAKHGTPYIEPLYNEQDAYNALKQFVSVPFDQLFDLAQNCHFRFSSTAHILGAACIYLTYNKTTILFSGDVGRLHDPIMREPSVIEPADYIVIESTYGDRIHDTESPETQLENIIHEAVKRGGSVIIPAFAIGRTQSMLYYLAQLKAQHRIPDLPIFLDSPMAQAVTDLYAEYIGKHQLSSAQCLGLNHVATYVNSTIESQAIADLQSPMIIIAASGMAVGGRILHHIKSYAPHAKNTLLFTGFQAEETLGERITQGQQRVAIHGEEVTIKSQVSMLKNVSAHADSVEIVTWLSQLKHTPRQVFITHGEPKASVALKQKIETQLHWTCMIPSHLQKVNISS